MPKLTDDELATLLSKLDGEAKVLDVQIDFDVVALALTLSLN